jgi:hypothetical protein
LIVQLLKEQNKYDQMPSILLDQLQRILPLADKVADEIVSEETEVLDKIMPRMFEVMQRIAEFLCDYVKRGRFSRLSSSLDSANTDDRSQREQERRSFIRRAMRSLKKWAES